MPSLEDFTARLKRRNKAKLKAVLLDQVMGACGVINAIGAGVCLTARSVLHNRELLCLINYGVSPVLLGAALGLHLVHSF